MGLLHFASGRQLRMLEMLTVQNEREHNFDLLIARAKSTSNYIEVKYVGQKSLLNSILWIATILFVWGMGWLAYALTFGLGEEPSLDARLETIFKADNITSFPTILILISIVLFCAAPLIYTRMRANLLNLRISQQRLRNAIEQAEQLVLNDHG